MIDESELSVAAFQEIERNGIYDDIPLSDRLHTFDIEFNPDDIERLKQRIIDCRLYISKNYNL